MADGVSISVRWSWLARVMSGKDTGSLLRMALITIFIVEAIVVVVLGEPRADWGGRIGLLASAALLTATVMRPRPRTRTGLLDSVAVTVGFFSLTLGLQDQDLATNLLYAGTCLFALQPSLLGALVMMLLQCGGYLLAWALVHGFDALGLPLGQLRGLPITLAAVYGFGWTLRRFEQALRGAEIINRAGLDFAAKDRAGTLRAGLKAAVALVQLETPRPTQIEASVVTRRATDRFMVSATTVERTLPYLPEVELEPVLGPDWQDRELEQVLHPREGLARAMAMVHKQGTVLLTPLLAGGDLLGLLAVGFVGRLTPGGARTVQTLATSLASTLAREQLHDKLAHARAEAQFQSLVQNASDLILVVRGDLSIAYQSPSVERVLGYASDSLLGEDVETLAEPEAAPALVQVLRGARRLEPDAPMSFRSSLVDATGGCRRVEISVANRLDEPAVGGLVLNVHDITAREEASEALQRSEAALRQAHKLDAVGRLAGGIAHDFNNIIGAIMVSAGLLRDELDRGKPGVELLDEIEQTAGRAAQLTRQLLTFSRAGDPEPELVDLGETVEGLHRMLRRLIGERIELCHRCEESLPSVKVDPGMLEQAVVNLVVNARDALPDGGRITLWTESRELVDPRPAQPGGEIPAGSYVVLSVADDGIGMSPEVRSRIFEPFFTTKDPDKGTGLGLAMVYGIVRQSSGHLEVDSQPGRGTRFSIYLPARARSSARPLPVARPAAPHGKGHLLIVEDDETLRRAAARILERLGYQVVTAADGFEAERLFLEATAGFDLVLTDVVMPKLNGTELMKRLRAYQDDLKVLYMSGYSEGVLVSLGSAETLLHKPFRPEELAEAVAAMLAPDPDDSGASRRPPLDRGRALTPV